MAQTIKSTTRQLSPFPCRWRGRPPFSTINRHWSASWWPNGSTLNDRLPCFEFLVKMWGTFKSSLAENSLGFIPSATSQDSTCFSYTRRLTHVREFTKHLAFTFARSLVMKSRKCVKLSIADTQGRMRACFEAFVVVAAPKMIIPQSPAKITSRWDMQSYLKWSVL